MPPEPWIKKVKLSCSIMHIDALAVAVINDHKNRDVARHWLGGASAFPN